MRLRAILNRTYNVRAFPLLSTYVPFEFKMKEKSLPVVEFVAHVLNPPQPSTDALRAEIFARWSYFVLTKSYEA